MRIFIIGSPADANSQQNDGFTSFCFELGKELASKNIELVLCSPFKDSADYYVMEGIKSSVNKKLSLQLYYPKTDELEKLWNSLLQGLEDSIKVTKFRQESPLVQERESVSYSWLFCQLQGIANSDFAIVIGGKLSGSSNLLLRLADAQEKTIIPIKKFGGVGELFYEKKKYQLSDKFGYNYSEELFGNLTPDSLVDKLINKPKDTELVNIQNSNNEKLTFFISYSREKPAKADLIETILRRRNFTVIRDENNIAASQDIPNAIKENILKSDIFIALWCKEYACSPWCYDELSIALDSHTKEGKSLWIFRTDKTRIVHPKARKLLWFDVENREQIEGKILSLLGK
jgi:hypothetical protein